MGDSPPNATEPEAWVEITVDEVGVSAGVLDRLLELGVDVVGFTAFIENLRRGHYELAVDTVPMFRLVTAFDELRPAI